MKKLARRQQQQQEQQNSQRLGQGTKLHKLHTRWKLCVSKLFIWEIFNNSIFTFFILQPYFTLKCAFLIVTPVGLMRAGSSALLITDCIKRGHHLHGVTNSFLESDCDVFKKNCICKKNQKRCSLHARLLVGGVTL